MDLIDLHKLTIEELSQLQREVAEYFSLWFGGLPRTRALRTQEWVDQAKWRLEGQTAPCCECGDDYAMADLHFDGEIYCPKCRKPPADHSQLLKG